MEWTQSFLPAWNRGKSRNCVEKALRIYIMIGLHGMKKSTDSRRFKKVPTQMSRNFFLYIFLIRHNRNNSEYHAHGCLHALYADMLVRTVEAVATGSEVRAGKPHEA